MTTFDSIKKISLIFKGNIFETWHSFDEELNRDIFLKIPLNSLDSKVLKLFESQNEALNNLNHPSILKPLWTNYKNDIAIAFPYLPKNKWHQLSKSIFEKNPQEILKQIIRVVHFIHCMGYVHGDLKESSFLINECNSKIKIKLIDYDMILPIGSKRSALITGTPGYIAPEIIRNELVHPKNDFYSLGRFLLSLINKSNSEVNTFLNNSSKKMMSINKYDRPDSLFKLIEENNFLNIKEINNLIYQTLLDVITSQLKINKNILTRKKHSFYDFLIQKVRITGLPEEFINDLESNSDIGFKTKIKLFKELIKTAKVEYVHGFWIIEPNLIEIQRIYIELQLIPDISSVQLTKEQITNYLLKAIKLRIQKASFKAMIIVQHIFSILDKNEQLTTKEFYSKTVFLLAQLYLKNGHVKKANHYFQLALDNRKLNSRKTILALLELANFNLVGQDLESYQVYLLKALKIATTERMKDKIFHIKSKLLYREYQSSKSKDIIQDLIKLFDDTINSKKYVQSIFTCNTLGIIYWSESDFAKAKEWLEKGVALVKSTKNYNLEALFINLGLVYYEMGKYKLTILNLTKAKKLLSNKHDNRKLAFVYTGLITTYTTLGDHLAAEKYLTKQLNIRSRIGGHAEIASYKLDKGWFYLRSGKYIECYDNLKEVCNIADRFMLKWLKGRAKLILAKLHYYQGEYNLAKSDIDVALSIFTPDYNKVYNLDSRMCKIFINNKFKSSIPEKKINEILTGYEETNNQLGILDTILHLLCENKVNLISKLLDKTKFVNDAIKNSTSPLGKSMKLWVSSISKENSYDIRKLKKTYQILFNSKFYYPSIIILKQISNYYSIQNNSRLAFKFLKEAEYIAELLSNKKLLKEIEIEINELDLSEKEEFQELQMFKEIGELLNSLIHPKEIIYKLLEYSLDISSSERVILLIRNTDEEDFKVAGSLFCDKQSIKDAINISMNTAKDTYSKEMPLIIEDALYDKRTKSYKSIIKHNVLSVATVPIYSKGIITGVLYLDHHSLPRLFSKTDLKILKALGDFIGIALRFNDEIRKIENKNIELSSLLKEHGIETKFITQNEHMLSILNKLPRIARSNANILIEGESGTGKEIIARLCHSLSLRNTGPLVSINCSTLDGNLLTSDLFGIKERTATNVDKRIGKIEAADGGTLFLDEVTEMPLKTQTMLLRTLESKEITRLGSNKVIPVDIRIVSASNRDVDKCVSNKILRMDLYYRINTYQIKIPPLRERIEDIPVLALSFWKAFSKNNAARIDNNAIILFKKYKWPGNVRELRNVIEQISIFKDDYVIRVEDLPKNIRSLDKKYLRIKFKDKIENVEQNHIIEALEQFQWNNRIVAKQLGIPLTTLYDKLKKYNIKKK